MGIGTLTVKTRLAVGFGALSGCVLVVSVLSLQALGRAHDEFSDYVNATSARVALAQSILHETDARAIGARNLVILTDPAERDAERAAVVRAHDRLGASVGRLKQLIGQASGVSPQEQTLFDEFERVESRYGPVALEIVRLALAGQREQAILKMNAECRPLLAALVKAAHDYIA